MGRKKAEPMVKRQITLSRPVDEFLVSEASRAGVGVSELIRRIVDDFRRGLAGRFVYRKPEKSEKLKKSEEFDFERDDFEV